MKILPKQKNILVRIIVTANILREVKNVCLHEDN